jgi:two-component system LytT family response regulator
MSRAAKTISQKTPENPRIPIPIKYGLRFVNIDEILYCSADDTRTVFHLFNKKKISTARVLKHVEEQTKSFGFIRIHRSYLINPTYLEEYNKQDGGYVVMSNGDRLPITKGKDLLL